MIDKKTAWIVLLMVLATGLGVIYYNNTVQKIEKAEKARLIDIKANPQNYFVSEGGTKPDPEVAEEAPAEPTE